MSSPLTVVMISRVFVYVQMHQLYILNMSSFLYTSHTLIMPFFKKDIFKALINAPYFFYSVFHSFPHFIMHLINVYRVLAICQESGTQDPVYRLHVSTEFLESILILTLSQTSPFQT